MNDALEIARGALGIWTVGHSFIWYAYDRSIAYGAVLREMIDLLVAGASLHDRLYYLGYYLACALHKYPIADTQVFALNVSFVV